MLHGTNNNSKQFVTFEILLHTADATSVTVHFIRRNKHLIRSFLCSFNTGQAMFGFAQQTLTESFSIVSIGACSTHTALSNQGRVATMCLSLEWLKKTGELTVVDKWELGLLHPEVLKHSYLAKMHGNCVPLACVAFYPSTHPMFPMERVKMLNLVTALAWCWAPLRF